MDKSSSINKTEKKSDTENNKKGPIYSSVYLAFRACVQIQVALIASVEIRLHPGLLHPQCIQITPVSIWQGKVLQKFYCQALIIDTRRTQLCDFNGFYASAVAITNQCNHWVRYMESHKLHFKESWRHSFLITYCCGICFSYTDRQTDYFVDQNFVKSHISADMQFFWIREIYHNVHSGTKIKHLTWNSPMTPHSSPFKQKLEQSVEDWDPYAMDMADLRTGMARPSTGDAGTKLFHELEE